MAAGLSGSFTHTICSTGPDQSSNRGTQTASISVSPSAIMARGPPHWIAMYWYRCGNLHLETKSSAIHSWFQPWSKILAMLPTFHFGEVKGGFGSAEAQTENSSDSSGTGGLSISGNTSTLSTFLPISQTMKSVSVLTS